MGVLGGELKFAGSSIACKCFVGVWKCECDAMELLSSSVQFSSGNKFRKF